MRALFASTRGAGHLGPLLPVAGAWRAAGHEVRIACPSDIEDTVARAGHEWWPVDPPRDEELGPVWARVPSLDEREQNVVVIGEIFATLNVRAALPRLQELFEEWRPDVVVRDPNEYASAIAAERHGVPHARVAISLVWSEEFAMKIAAPKVDVLRREAGLPSDPEGAALRDSPFLTAFPASLEDPEADTQPDLLRFRDPAWDAEPAPLPAWWDEDDQPLVYVTFGSIAGSFEQALPIFGMAIEALAPLPVRVLLTTGLGPDADAIAAQAPAHVHVERWVPQADVLPHAAAVVCHAGSGSTLGALAAGVPIVAVPLFADQPINARLVEAAGAGVAIDERDVPNLGGIVGALLDEPRYRAAARAIADEMQALPPVDAAVELLERLQVTAGA